MKLIISLPIYISNELHAEFTEGTVRSIKTSHDHEIILINNYCAPEYLSRMKALTKVIPNTENNVSSAWNLGISYGIGRKADYVLTPNNDLIFRHDAVDNLVKFACLHPEFVLWTAAEYTDMRTLELHQPDNNFDEHPHFSCFMVSSKFPEILKGKEKEIPDEAILKTSKKLNRLLAKPALGYFDTNFRIAYFEDQDMAHRIARAGLRAVKTGSALFYHFGSRTIKVDDELNKANVRNYEDNRWYFKEKWGYDPHQFCPASEGERLEKSYKNPFNT